MKRFFLFLIASFLMTTALVLIPAGGPTGLLPFLVGGDPLLLVLLWTLGFALTAFAFGFITADYSWVDRLWSTLPVGFVWFYAWRGGFSCPLVLAAAVVTVWGTRLTFNFARKGGYTGAEDYRWPVLRERIGNPFFWQLFNLGFICLYQTGLFVLFTSPMYMMLSRPSGSGSPLFIGALGLMLLSVLFETVADQQQWTYYRARESFRAGKTIPHGFLVDAERGFRTTGLFAVSRHPNYFGELSFWWFFWLAGAFHTGIWLSWTLAGPVLLSLLFVGSTIFTEGITGSKYPEYAGYKNRVSAIVPWFPKRTGP